MKVDPVVRSLPEGLAFRLVHTGQHYDREMSQAFFEQLELPAPDINLGAGSASNTEQTARIMIEYEKVLTQGSSGLPELVVVVGDVNSTVACALTAARYNVPVAHVEAGLRSFDRRMPEEINRVLTDQIASLLLITSPEARGNLVREGRSSETVVMVGNPMIDTLLRLLPRAREAGARCPSGPFCLVTLHRPSNVDDPARLARIVAAMAATPDVEFLFPAHPRTMAAFEGSGLLSSLPGNLDLRKPMDYLSFIGLEERASAVLTDSGGVQEETSVLGVPCVTLRENTERPVTLSIGTNVLCPEPDELPGVLGEAIARRPAHPASIPFWDGRAGERIARAICSFLDRDGPGPDGGDSR